MEAVEARNYERTLAYDHARELLEKHSVLLTAVMPKDAPVSRLYCFDPALIDSKRLTREMQRAWEYLSFRGLLYIRDDYTLTRTGIALGVLPLQLEAVAG